MACGNSLHRKPWSRWTGVWNVWTGDGMSTMYGWFMMELPIKMVHESWSIHEKTWFAVEHGNLGVVLPIERWRLSMLMSVFQRVNQSMDGWFHGKIQKWMGYFMENPSRNGWFGDTRYFGKPPYVLLVSSTAPPLLGSKFAALGLETRRNPITGSWGCSWSIFGKWC